MLVLLILSIVGAVFVAFNNGANDVANAFASAVGAKALKIKHALIVAAVLNFLGAIILGANVSKTLISGITNVKHFTDIHSYVIGMLACMIAAGSFIFISTCTGLPVSSTHSIVGGLAGVAIANGGVKAVNWKFLSGLTATWLFTPLLSAAIALWTIKLIRMAIYRGDPKFIMQRAKVCLPLLASAIVVAVMISIAHGTNLWKIFPKSGILLFTAGICFPLTYFIVGKITHELILRFKERKFGIEHIFRRFQAGTSCLIGFAIGSSDVSNSVTPAVVIYFMYKLGTIPDSSANLSIPVWLLAIGGLGMSWGVLSLGHKVIATLGQRITSLTNSRGFSVDFATATTIILASVFGIPISSTHAATGAIVGVGLERGTKELNIRLLLKIFITWCVTIPTSGIFTTLIYYALRWLISVFS